MANTSPTPEKQEDKVGNTITEATVFAKIIAKNFLSLPSIARDLNVARQNIIKLVKLRGGESTNKADAMFLKSSEAETKLGVEKQKLTAKEVTPTPAEKEEVGMGGRFISRMLGKTKLGKKLLNSKLIKGFSKIFSVGGFARILSRLALPLLIFSAVWEGITGAFETWKETGSIWETFKSFAGGIVDFFTFGLIDKQMVSDFYDWMLGAYEKIGQSIADFFGFGDWFTEKFAKVKDYLGVGVKAKKISPEVEQPEIEQEEAKKKEPKVVEIEKKRKEKQDEEERKQAQQGTVLTSEEGTPVLSGTGEPIGVGEPTPAPAPAPSPTPVPTEKKKEEKAPTKAPSPGFAAGKSAMLSAMDKEGITNPDARAQIMAQAAHESGSFRYTEELGKPAYFEKYNGRKDLGNTQPGDGPRFKGRGFLQTTGRVNYDQFKQAFGVDVIEKPEVLAEAKYAADSALFWFKKNAKKVEKLSGGDWANTKGVTKAVNGGFNGLEDRMQYFEKFRNDPTITKVASNTTAPEGSQVAATSSAVASEQRKQQKPQTPVIVNAQTTNNSTTTVNRTTVAQNRDNSGTNSALVARAA